MTIRLILLMLLLAAGGLPAQTGDASREDWPDGSEILARVDSNALATNRVFTSTMIIHGRRGSRTVTSKSYVSGTEKSFTEYLSPPREAGTKMLKLDDQLWTYSPETDRTIRISGHMLRQSVMGSDLSYEDMMEDKSLSRLYAATVVGDTVKNERPCWILELTATAGDPAYYRRRVWVDQERYVVWREERFAKSGKLLKTTDVKEVMQRDGRWAISHVVFKDELKKGKGTEFILDDLQYDAVIPAYVFTKAALRR